MDNITKQLAAEYDLSALRKEAEIAPRVQDREKFQMISKRYAKLVRDQTHAYERSYDNRLDMASRHICQRHGKDWRQIAARKDSNGLSLQRRIKAQAHREVQGDHLRRVALLRNREAGELKELVETMRQREIQKQGDKHPMPEAPKLLTDRRNDPERQIIRPRH